MRIALALLALAPISARAERVAQAGRLSAGAGPLVVGVPAGKAAAALDCSAGTVQHTILRCKLKPADSGAATCLGHPVSSATLNLHFQGDVLNAAVEFERAIGFDRLLSDARALVGTEPKVQYWADDAHLYASYIWVDGDAELELTRTIKGPDEGPLRAYLSSLAGGRPLHPQDAR